MLSKLKLLPHGKLLKAPGLVTDAHGCEVKLRSCLRAAERGTTSYVYLSLGCDIRQTGAASLPVMFCELKKKICFLE